MNPDDRPETTNGNDRTYDRLIASLEMGLGQLQVLLASCDNDRQRLAWIDRYEAELQGQAQPQRVRLDATEPSLHQAVARALADGTDPSLPIVVTVTGSEALGLTGPEPIEKFLGYLQWTREALREFALPIVLWLPERLLPELPRKAPDFWSWRDGVFLFKVVTQAAVSPSEIIPERIEPQPSDSNDAGSLSIADLEASLAAAETQLGPNSLAVADLLRQLGDRYADRYRAGRGPEEAIPAEAYFQRAIALYETHERSADLATSLNNLAYLYKSQGRYEEAEPPYRQSLAIREETLGDNHPDTAASLNGLAALYESQGRYEEAEPLYQQSLVIRETILGDKHPDTAASLNSLATLYYSKGCYAEAEPLFRRSLAIREEILGDNHPDTAASVNDLANLYRSQGRYAEAEPLFRRSLAIYEQVLGADHPDTATSINDLANLFRFQERYAEAEPLFRRSLAIYEQVLGADHPYTATGLNNLANIYRLQGRYAEAEPIYWRSMAIREKVLGSSHPETAVSQCNLGQIYVALGRYSQAESLLLSALNNFEKVFNSDHFYVQETIRRLHVLGQTVLEADRTAELSDHPLTQAILQELTAPPETP